MSSTASVPRLDRSGIAAPVLAGLHELEGAERRHALRLLALQTASHRLNGQAFCTPSLLALRVTDRALLKIVTSRVLLRIQDRR